MQQGNTRRVNYVAEGAKPKFRLYSRLNWAGLLQPTMYPASLAFLPSLWFGDRFLEMTLGRMVS